MDRPVKPIMSFRGVNCVRRVIYFEYLFNFIWQSSLAYSSIVFRLSLAVVQTLDSKVRPEWTIFSGTSSVEPSESFFSQTLRTNKESLEKRCPEQSLSLVTKTISLSLSLSKNFSKRESDCFSERIGNRASTWIRRLSFRKTAIMIHIWAAC